MTQYGCGLVVLLCPVVALAAPPSFTVFGGNDAAAYAMSADGTVVAGTSRPPGGGAVFAYRWSRSDGFQFLEGPSGTVPGRVRGVSADGQVLVGGRGAGGQAFRWTAPSTLTFLGFLSGPTFPYSEASAVSADGSVIVGDSGNQALTNAQHAVRWTQATGMVALNPPAGWGALNNSAMALTPSGQFVAGTALNGGRRQGVKWDAGGNVSPLAEPIPGGEAIPFAISPDGSNLAGWAQPPGSFKRACRWTPSGTQLLGDLSPLGSNSFAEGISGDGASIVGQSNGTAFLWTADRGMRSLADVLTQDCGISLSGLSLLDAAAITPDGLTIAGTALTPNAGTIAFVAVIPAPATGGPLLVVTLICLRRRR